MDFVWVLAAVVIMLAALGVAVWLVKLGRDMAGYVAQAQRAVVRLDAIVAEAEGAHRAEPADPPEVVAQRRASDEVMPYPYDDPDDAYGLPEDTDIEDLQAMGYSSPGEWFAASPAERRAALDKRDRNHG